MNTIRKHRIFVRLDFWVQSAMFVVLIGGVMTISPFFAMVMAVPIGAWQVMNGLVYLFVFKKINRKPYLVGAAAGLFLFFIALQQNGWEVEVMSLIIILSIWSYALTARDL